MNGAQDLGGMQGFGPVLPEAGEPLFHAPWERRVLGVTLALGARGKWNIDMSRAARESLPPARYLAYSYYRIWFEGLARLLVDKGLATPQEIATGQMSMPPLAGVTALPVERVAAVLARGSPTLREARVVARFAPGDAVRTRQMNPLAHTRLPRYCRGRRGSIDAVRGVHVFADAHAAGQGEAPQWLYSVRFDAAELWGADTTASAVYVDLWESYLEPA